MIRTLSEILIDADNAKAPYVLSDCWAEIVDNKYCYPLVQLHFAKEHILGLSLKMYNDFNNSIK